MHLEGTVLPETLLRIATRNDYHLPVSTIREVQDLYAFTSFEHFLDVWNLTTNCLQTEQDFAEITLDYAAQAARHGARYVEAIFSPSERVIRGVPFEALFEGYCAGAMAAWDTHGVLVRLTPDLYWSVDPELAEQTARFAVRYGDRGIVGLGIGGNERMARPADYQRAFDIARDGGLHAVPHVGEVGGPAQMSEVIDRFTPRRIRHGIGASTDPDLLARLRDEGIGLDLCPTSNVRTGAVATLEDVPIEIIRDVGVRFTVNTDDPAMFGTDLSREYDIARARGVTESELWDNVLATSGVEESELSRLIAETSEQPPAGFGSHGNLTGRT